MLKTLLNIIKHHTITQCAYYAFPEEGRYLDPFPLPFVYRSEPGIAVRQNKCPFPSQIFSVTSDFHLWTSAQTVLSAPSVSALHPSNLDFYPQTENAKVFCNV